MKEFYNPFNTHKYQKNTKQTNKQKNCLKSKEMAERMKNSLRSQKEIQADVSYMCLLLNWSLDMKSWYITDSLAAESLTKHTIFWHLENQEMLKPIRVSKHLDFLFQSIFYLLNKKTGIKKKYIPQRIRSIQEGRIIDISCLQKHWMQLSHQNHEKKTSLRKIKGKSSPSLHFRFFMFQITFTISVNK